MTATESAGTVTECIATIDDPYQRFAAVIRALTELRDAVRGVPGPADADLELAQQLLMYAAWGFLRDPATVTRLSNALLNLARARVGRADAQGALNGALQQANLVNKQLIARRDYGTGVTT